LKREKIAFSNLERKMRSQRTKPLEKLHRSVLPLEDTRELHDANLSTHYPVIDSPATRRRRPLTNPVEIFFYYYAKREAAKGNTSTRKAKEREKKKLFCCKTLEYRSKEQIY
jgi:hypothetical protein